MESRCFVEIKNQFFCPTKNDAQNNKIMGINKYNDGDSNEMQRVVDPSIDPSDRKSSTKYPFPRVTTKAYFGNRLKKGKLIVGSYKADERSALQKRGYKNTSTLINSR